MEYRKLGKTGLKVSIIGFGGIPIQRVSKEEAIKIIEWALDLGINFIDTARGYSDSEEKIGEVIKRRRKECYLATKTSKRTKEEAKQELEISLKSLGIDKIDLYQVHWVNDELTLNQIMGPGGALEAFREAKGEGKIDHIGITGHVSDLLIKAIKTGEFETVQFPFNVIEREPEKELIALAKKLNIGTIVMKPMAGGAITMGAASLKFILEHSIDTIIPGMQSLRDVEENAKVVNAFTPLTPEEREKLYALAEELGSEFCRRCEYCRPCPEGINISGLWFLRSHLKGKATEELEDWVLRDYRKMAPTLEACTECGTCETKCPYNLPIIKVVKEMKSKFLSK